MTAATINAEFVVVNIVGTVAAAAAAINKFHFLECAAVAVVAGHFYVRAFQSKIGLHVMVEVPKVPGNWIVAGITTPGETAAMWVILVVAAGALRLHLFVSLRLVTVFTFVVIVRAEQRKRRQVVIKKDRILPVDFGMAGFTEGSE